MAFPNSRSRSVCTFFVRGCCTRYNCPYEHPARTAAAAAPQPRRVCTFFQQGRCTRYNCPYEHVAAAPAADNKSNVETWDEICCAIVSAATANNTPDAQWANEFLKNNITAVLVWAETVLSKETEEEDAWITRSSQYITDAILADPELKRFFVEVADSFVSFYIRELDEDEELDAGAEAQNDAIEIATDASVAGF